jgi:type IV pilus assembly protein PilC
LNRLASFLEKNDKLKRKVKAAMSYPGIVLGVSFVVISILLLKVVPTFETMFAEFGGTLPAPTQFVIDLSDWLQTNFLYVFGGIALIGVAIVKSYQHPKGRVKWDAFLLATPVFGNVIRKTAVARFCRTLGTMVASGVPILEALTICARTSGNRIIENAIYATRDAISEGRTIADPLLESGVFPEMVCQMISVGEATGALDVMLNKIADFYDDEVDQAVAAMTGMMEPAIMAFLGVVIGGLVIAMYLPVFTMAGNIG